MTRSLQRRDYWQLAADIDFMMEGLERIKHLASTPYPAEHNGFGMELRLREIHDVATQALTTNQSDTPYSRPTIVCLCGSTRFWRQFQRSSLEETLAGRIVLSIGAASGTDDEHFGNLPQEEYDRLKVRLDQLHLRKIDISDEVLILNVNGYVGESTRNELFYARAHHKVIRWLEPDKALP
jgi:hypothetical protein